MNKIRIVLVDDQNLVREGLSSLIQLSSTMIVVAEANDGDAAITLLLEYQPDVLLLDIRMPKTSGLDVLRQMQLHNINTPCLILTTFDDHDLVLECIHLGAKGYLRKDVRFEDLSKAIISLAQGGTWYQPAVTCQIEYSQRKSNKKHDQKTTQLTVTEIQILRLVAAGYPNSEIATALCKSSGTVRNQVSAILTKLNARDRTRAVLKALELKII